MPASVFAVRRMDMSVVEIGEKFTARFVGPNRLILIFRLFTDFMNLHD